MLSGDNFILQTFKFITNYFRIWNHIIGIITTTTFKLSITTTSMKIILLIIIMMILIICSLFDINLLSLIRIRITSEFINLLYGSFHFLYLVFLGITHYSIFIFNICHISHKGIQLKALIIFSLLRQ